MKAKKALLTRGITGYTTAARENGIVRFTALGAERKAPDDILKEYKAYLLTDGYAVYDDFARIGYLLKDWILQGYPKVLPKSPVAQAMAYCFLRWEKLWIYTSDARLNIDNNPAENAIRPWPLAGKIIYLQEAMKLHNGPQWFTPCLQHAACTRLIPMNGSQRCTRKHAPVHHFKHCRTPAANWKKYTIIKLRAFNHKMQLDGGIPRNDAAE